MKTLAFYLALLATASATEVWPNARAVIAGESPKTAEKTILPPNGPKIVARFNITTKGNGVVSIPGLSIRVYDSHDDGLIFRDGLLRCEWNFEHSVEFIVSGIAETTEDKKEEIPVRGLFRYNSTKKIFEPISVLSSNRLLERMKKTEPNQSLQRTSTAVTDRAAHAPRQLLRSLT